jgi:omega-6 fatty acid desaturase (delta-12 desaturase)
MVSVETDPHGLRKTLAAYHSPSWGRSVGELLVTLIPLVILWSAAFYAVAVGWWWGVLLTIPAAAFLVRLFLIQHDCGHGSFFPSKTANDWLGRIAAVATMTPYGYWRRTHAIHHATSGNLDRRSLGAVETLTVAEYRALPWLKRLGYRLYRHPLVMFGLGPTYMFLLQHRLPIGLMRERQAWLSVMGTNLGLAAFSLPLLLFQPTAFLLVHLPIVVIAGSIGFWLFYVQHQFEGAWWARNEAWSLHEASFKGSSHLDLPPVLRWLTANIGAHHVHHMSSRIPFYRLQQVMGDHPELHPMSRITLRDTASTVRLSLWDEVNGRMVSFHDASRGAVTAKAPLLAA